MPDCASEGSACEGPDRSELERRQAEIDLFFAAASGSVEKARTLLEARVDPNARDFEQRCPLHVAAGSGKSLKVIEALIEFRASVNAMDCWGQTPLDQAQRGEWRKIERLLNRNGAKLLKQRMQAKSMCEKWEIKRSQVQLGQELGRTLKSVVRRANWNGVDVVAKFCLPDELGKIPQEMEDEILHEISLLATVRHPDLVMFLGCCLQDSPIMFITQFMPNGDLERYYGARAAEKGAGPWRPANKVVNRWGRSILRALNFLHHCSEPIIHRDLKPLNILLTEDLEVKVSDFGTSTTTPFILSPATSSEKRFTASEVVEEYVSRQSSSFEMTGGVGSWRYMAPEVARHQHYTEKVDIFAFGLILYFMSSGRQPFRDYPDPLEVLTKYSMGDEPRPKATDCPLCFRSIMEDAWHVVPDSRPDAGDLMERMVEIHSGGHKCGCTAM